MYCNFCGNELPDKALYCHHCGRAVRTAATPGEAGRRILERPRRGRKIAGVCLGIAHYLDIDPTLCRILAILTIFLGLGGVIAYIVAWILIPEEPLPAAPRPVSAMPGS